MKKMNNKTKDSTTSPRRIIHLRTELLLSFTLLTVVITLLLAFVFLHEKITIKSAIGCTLIGAGTLLMVL